MKGWIKLHRKIMENREYLQIPFDRVRAWIDLLLLANHDEGGFYIRSNRVTIPAGHVGNSEESLSARWQWSREKVRRFLKDMERDGRIKQHKSHVLSLIEIVNWNEYQYNEKELSQTRQQTRQQNRVKTRQQELTETRQQETQGLPLKQAVKKEDETTDETTGKMKNDTTDETTETGKNEHKQEEQEVRSKEEIQSPKGLQQVEPIKSFGNPQINEMLLALKSILGIDSFVDAHLERNIAKHLVTLMDKLTPAVFKSRLDAMLSDDFTRKNCNKILYLYRNLKGFMPPAPSLKNPYAVDTQARAP